MKELDNAALATVTPDANHAGNGAVKKGAEPAGQDEFNLHHDGTLMKYIDRPGFAPQCLLVDGAGRQFGIARNPAVADLICNGVNAVNLARVMQMAEDAEKNKTPGSDAPLIIPAPEGCI